MRGGEPRTTMGTRPGLLVVVVSSLSVILPGSYQYPQHVVFQPVTHQLTSKGQFDPDFSLVFPPTIRASNEALEDKSNQLICKKIQHGDGLFRMSPSSQSNQLFFVPSPVIPPLSEPLFSRFFLAVPSIPSVGVSADDLQPETPEGAFAASPPLITSLCVSQDSPRPFPVLFAPPPPSETSSIDNDFRKYTLMKPADMSLYSTEIRGLENPLKVSLNTPSMGGVTLGLHGVPATVESSSPSWDDPAGKILIRLHTNPPGSITLGFTGEGRTSRKPEEFDPDFNTYRVNSLLTHTPTSSVSLYVNKPVGSIGIASPNSPAVNIEKQNIITSSSTSRKVTTP